MCEKRRKNFFLQGTTLVELIIATILSAIISLGIFGVVLYSRHEALFAQRRAIAQNNASFAIDHLSRNISRGIGNTIIAGLAPTTTGNVSGRTAIRVAVDSNPPPDGNGQQDLLDNVICYRWRDNGGDRFELHFCPDCQGPDKPSKFLSCNNCNPNWNNTEIVADNIEYWGSWGGAPGNPPNVVDDYVEVEVQACFDATTLIAGACGGPDNPRVTLRVRIKMPAVSTQ